MSWRQMLAVILETTAVAISIGPNMVAVAVATTIEVATKALAATSTKDVVTKDGVTDVAAKDVAADMAKDVTSGRDHNKSPVESAVATKKKLKNKKRTKREACWC